MILEDDLYVSPDYYNYAMKALEKYGDHPKIAGISLNTKRELLESPYPFFPRHTGYDVYFQQFASSWGQVWNRRMWTDFKEWYDQHPTLAMECECTADRAELSGYFMGKILSDLCGGAG